MKGGVFAGAEAVSTGDGTYSLRHPDHGELFHSFSGAGLEARDLYIRGSTIQERWEQEQGARVLDIGLGLGYNALTTLSEYLMTGRGNLELVSVELESELVELLRSGSASWQCGWPALWLELVKKIEPVSSQCFSARGRGWHWTIWCGDAFGIPLDGAFDYIWQDPFSPSKNPRMWSAEWFQKLRGVAHNDTELLSYSVSRVVKDAMELGGWDYERIPTTTSKRHWLRAKPRRANTI